MDQSEPSATQLFLAEDIEQSKHFLPVQTNDQSELSAMQFFLAELPLEEVNPGPMVTTLRP